jgi:hypothetical protein
MRKEEAIKRIVLAVAQCGDLSGSLNQGKEHLIRERSASARLSDANDVASEPLRTGEPLLKAQV